MAKPKAGDKPEQKPLIPLTDEEMKAAPKKLANLIKDLEELEAEHKEVHAKQAKERKKVRGQIASLAGQIRSQGR